MSTDNQTIPVSKGLLAISPIVVFLLSYLVTSLILGDFYKMPLSVAFLIASVWGAFTMKGRAISQRVDAFSKGASSSNVMYMVWIFILAGAFASVAKYAGAVEATVSMTLGFLPSALIVPGLFVATCFISMAIGTSVGTVVAITPLAVEMANNTGTPVPFFVAIVLGGAFFGDNLSFISDTTIAATRTQGTDMRQKFLANVKIVFPAALISLILYCVNSPQTDSVHIAENTQWWFVLPYLVVIGMALMGINVTIVLLCGILSVLVLTLFNGVSIIDFFSVAGEGIESVGGLIIITLLAAGMLGMIKENGGIDFILQTLTRRIKSSRGGQLSIVLLVGIVNLCTANNTVAIITVGSLAKKISDKYGIMPRKAASLLDTGSCVVQALIPYGAQTLMATSLAGISPVSPWPMLFYPQVLIVCLAISIFIVRGKSRKETVTY